MTLGVILSVACLVGSLVRPPRPREVAVRGEVVRPLFERVRGLLVGKARVLLRVELAQLGSA